MLTHVNSAKYTKQPLLLILSKARQTKMEKGNNITNKTDKQLNMKARSVIAIGEKIVVLKVNNNLEGVLKLTASKMKEARENETYKIGDELDCIIKSFDKKNQKIVLTLSQEDK